MSDAVVKFDPAFTQGLTEAHRAAAEVHVLRARADEMRGPRWGDRALVLAMRASEVEQELLAAAGLERGAELLREMFDHPMTVAAIERWSYARQLARRLIFD